MKNILVITTFALLVLSGFSFFIALKSPAICYSFFDEPIRKTLFINNICGEDKVEIENEAQLADFINNIENYKHTKELSIKNLGLKAVPPEMSKLRELEYLDLGYNNITGFPMFLSEMKTLRVLYLHKQNGYLKDFSKYIDGFENLRVLELGGNSLEIVPSFIYELKELRYLNLEENKISKIPSDINKLETLELLNLLGNPIISIDLNNNIKYLLIDEKVSRLSSTQIKFNENIEIYYYKQAFNIGAFIY